MIWAVMFLTQPVVKWNCWSLLKFRAIENVEFKRIFDRYLEYFWNSYSLILFCIMRETDYNGTICYQYLFVSSVNLYSPRFPWLIIYQWLFSYWFNGGTLQCLQVFMEMYWFYVNIPRPFPLPYSLPCYTESKLCISLLSERVWISFDSE